MKLIIDAYNLLYRVDTKKSSLEAKREELISLIEEFMTVNKADVTLVFDGRNQESNTRGHDKRGPLKIIFSARGETADEIIMEMIQKRTGKAKEYVIVSSDNMIKNFALENHMNAMTSDEFIDYLT